MKKTNYTTWQKNPQATGLYGVFQSYQKGPPRLKAVYFNDEFCMPAVFFHKKDAEEFLARVIKTIKLGIKLGERPKNNLDPNESLDFCYLPVTLGYDKNILRTRQWKIE